MANLNKCCFIGRLTKEVETRTIPNGSKVSNFDIAVNESYKDKSGQKVESTEYIKCVVWRGLAEVAEKYLTKGSQIFLEGKMSTRSWDDKDGNKKYTTEIIGSNFQMLGGKSESTGEESQATQAPEEDLPF